ncbi:MAG: ATP-binding protein [Anaerolineaceae bacterium]|jgi:magnesium chelatase subunit I
MNSQTPPDSTSFPSPYFDGQEPPPHPTIRSLRELIAQVSGKSFTSDVLEPSGLAEILPFPFMGLVGQTEMKVALLLALINPAINGVILLGPRGTGKTTAVRSLLDLLPDIERSACFYGCLPQDIEAGGMDAVCPDCARKYAEGFPLTKTDRVRLVELPLNARIDDVVGGLDDRALVHERLRLKRGILAQADQNILYADEVNLLGDDVVDATLDAAAQGKYTVNRGPATATYNARFTLIGSMNPEEGSLRPQIMDRFGLRVIVRGLQNAQERLEAYRRVCAYTENPRQMIEHFKDETDQAREDIQQARRLLPQVELSSDLAHTCIEVIQRLKIDSLRAEINLFESARAYAASDGRNKVELKDVQAVAHMCLRLRRSSFITRYFQEQSEEDQEIEAALKSA